MTSHRLTCRQGQILPMSCFQGSSPNGNENETSSRRTCRQGQTLPCTDHGDVNNRTNIANSHQHRKILPMYVPFPLCPDQPASDKHSHSVQISPPRTSRARASPSRERYRYKFLEKPHSDQPVSDKLDHAHDVRISPTSRTSREAPLGQPASDKLDHHHVVRDQPASDKPPVGKPDQPHTTRISPPRTSRSICGHTLPQASWKAKPLMLNTSSARLADKQGAWWSQL